MAHILEGHTRMVAANPNKGQAAQGRAGGTQQQLASSIIQFSCFCARTGQRVSRELEGDTMRLYSDTRQAIEGEATTSAAPHLRRA